VLRFTDEFLRTKPGKAIHAEAGYASDD